MNNIVEDIVIVVLLIAMLGAFVMTGLALIELF